MAVSKDIDKNTPLRQRRGDGRGVGPDRAPVDGAGQLGLERRDLVGHRAKPPRTGVAGCVGQHSECGPQRHEPGAERAGLGSLPGAARCVGLGGEALARSTAA